MGKSRFQESGFRIQESEVRSQKSGVRSQESEVRSENEEHLLPAFCFLPSADCLLPLSEAGWRGVFEGLAGGPGEVRTLDLMTASHVRLVPRVDS